ncbi:MAG: LacI family DNA-binding transcriptional regulator [Planctomycetota bacterium]|jgi:LacI family transcriptional regulator
MLTENERPITIAMLANRIGVSVATVSSVLNNRYKQRRISPDTVRKVQKAAVEAGYLPNVAARRLRSGYSSQYLVLAAITSYQAPLPLVAGTITALHKLLGTEKYRNVHSMVTVEMFDAGKLAQLPGLLDGSRFNGAIIANTVAEDDAFLARNQSSVPMVLVGRDIPNYSSVRASPEKTGQQAADILFSTNSREPAVLYTRLLTQTTSGRLKGFSERISKLVMKEPIEIMADGFGEQDGYKTIRSCLSQRRKIDGLYCIMDSLAVGAYNALKERGLRIPQDIAVIGTGDYPIAAYLDPPLSTFTLSQNYLREEAARLLLGHLSGEIKMRTQILIPTVPVLRQSTHRGELAGP